MKNELMITVLVSGILLAAPPASAQEGGQAEQPASADPPAAEEPTEPVAEEVPAEESAEQPSMEVVAEPPPSMAVEPVAEPEVVEQEATTASDSELPSQTHGLAGIGLDLGLKVGGGLGKPLNDLGGTVQAELEVGYLLPLPGVLGRNLMVFAAFGYARPTTSESVVGDARLGSDGTWSYDLTVEEAILSFGALFRIPVGSQTLVPYAGLAGKAFLTKVTATGEAGGAAFGSNEELMTDYGAYFVGGIDLFLFGPGALTAELQSGYVGSDHFVRRETNNGTTNLMVGYRLFI